MVTAVSWAPNGEYFAIGAFGMLKLCDKTGWTHSHQKTDYGSVMDLQWSNDSSICAGATAKGYAFLGYITNKTLNWENWEANLTGDTEIVVNNILDERNGNLSFNDRVINVSFQYDYLIGITLTQCRIYNVNNWGTFASFDLKVDFY